MWLSPNLPLLPTVCQSAPILVSQPQSSPNLGQSAPISCPLGLWSSTLPLCAAWVRSPCALPWPCLGALSLRAACARCMGAACARCMGAACALHGRCLRAAWALPARCMGAACALLGRCACAQPTYCARVLPASVRSAEPSCLHDVRTACMLCARPSWSAANASCLCDRPATLARCWCARQPGRAACVRGSLGALPVCGAAWARCL